MDGQNHRIRHITQDGVVSTLAGSTKGFADGKGKDAQFNQPDYIAVDTFGKLYVTDDLNYRIRKIE